MKKRVFDEKGIEVDTQKIVYKGKVPNDGDTLASLSVKDNDHMVIMVLKVPKTLENARNTKEFVKETESNQCFSQTRGA